MRRGELTAVMKRELPRAILVQKVGVTVRLKNIRIVIIRRLALLGATLLFIAVLVTGLYVLPGTPTTPPPAGELPPSGLPTLTPAEPVVSDRRLPGVISAVIDNKAEARPQSGLERADVVMEMMAEGGITRYLAFFYSRGASVIGPIRSARPYFAEIAKAYSAPLAHAGGSMEALERIRSLNVPSIDEINNASRAFWRDRVRRMPHNLYTNTDRLVAEAERKRYPLRPLPPAPEGKMPSGEVAPRVLIAYSPEYKVEWLWQDGLFRRLINGAEHVMQDGAEITARNVIIMVAKHRREIANGTSNSTIDIIGTGQALFLRDGQVHRGTWAKESAREHFIFAVNGASYNYAPGNTWIQIVPYLTMVNITTD